MSPDPRRPQRRRRASPEPCAPWRTRARQGELEQELCAEPRRTWARGRTQAVQHLRSLSGPRTSTAFLTRGLLSGRVPARQRPFAGPSVAGPSPRGPRRGPTWRTPGPARHPARVPEQSSPPPTSFPAPPAASLGPPPRPGLITRHCARQMGLRDCASDHSYPPPPPPHIHTPSALASENRDAP